MSDTTPQPADDTVVDAGPVDSTESADPATTDDHDLATLLAKREHARPNRATWALLTLIVLAVGFVGGALTQRTWGTSSSSRSGLPDFSTMTGQLPGSFGTGSTTTDGSGSTSTDGSGSTAAGGQDSGRGGFGGFPGGGATFGTIASVDGDTLTITDASGKTVTIKVPSSATVTANTEVSLADLAVGDTVVVRGETADDGTVTATTVTEGSGGFPGGFGGGQPGQGGQSGTSSQSGGTAQPSGAPQPTTGTSD